MSLVSRPVAFLWLAMVWVLFVSTLPAQEEEEDSPVTINEIKFQPVPLIRVASQGTNADRMLSELWWQILVKFSSNPQPTNEGTGEPRSQSFVDEVTIRVYVDGIDETSTDGYVVLSSEVTFVNVPPGRDHFAAFYLYPTAAIRYGGVGAKEFRKSNVFAEALVGGQQVSKRMMKQEDGEDEEWHTRGRQIKNILVPFFESPWWPFEAGSYNQFKR